MDIMQATGHLLRGVLHLLVAVTLALFFIESAVAQSTCPSCEPHQSTDADADAAKNLVEVRLILALPAALQTGMTTGVGAVYARASGWLGWGAKASWSTATEYTLTENVRNDDIRLMLFGVVQYAAGRGTIGLRLGAGSVLVYEERTRSQGERAGLKGSALGKTIWAALPGIDLEFVVKLRMLDAWSITLSGGPECYLLRSDLRFGWLAGLGVAWQH